MEVGFDFAVPIKKLVREEDVADANQVFVDGKNKIFDQLFHVMVTTWILSWTWIKIEHLDSFETRLMTAKMEGQLLIRNIVCFAKTKKGHNHEAGIILLDFIFIARYF